MRSNSKAVRELVKSHIQSYYETVEALIADLDAVSYSNPTRYGQAKYLVDGGSFLIYHVDVNEFLKTLDLNGSDNEYDDMKSWELYKHLIASEVEKLVK